MKTDRKEYMRAYRLANRDRLKAANKAHYDSNKERLRSESLDRYRANKEAPFANWLRRTYWPDKTALQALFSYNLLYAAQGGVCAICGRPETRKEPRTGRLRRLSVDHCHSTGVVRGLLCGGCNTAIGLLGESIENVAKAFDYLKRHHF